MPVDPNPPCPTFTVLDAGSVVCFSRIAPAPPITSLDCDPPPAPTIHTIAGVDVGGFVESIFDPLKAVVTSDPVGSTKLNALDR